MATTKSEVIDAYTHLRETNTSISDETLDFMKNVSLQALEGKLVPVGEFQHVLLLAKTAISYTLGLEVENAHPDEMERRLRVALEAIVSLEK